MPTPETFDGIKDGPTLVPCKDAKAQNGVIANTKLIKDTVGWSGKNKLPKPNAASKTEYGTTYTYYPADQSFKVSTGGSASTGNCGMNFLTRESMMKIPAGQYIVSKGTNNADIELFANAYSGSSFVFVRQLFDLTAENGIFTIDYADYDFVEVGLYVKSGKTIPDTMVYPMFRPANILDDTYEPYFGSTAVDWSSYAKTGVHNLIPIYSFTGGTGITATINEDKSVSLTAGKVTSELVCPATINAFNLANTPFGVGDELTFTIGNNKKQSSIELQVLYKVTSAGSWTTLVDQSNVDSVSFTVPQCEILLVRFRVLGEVTATTLYPMLIFTADTDSNYASYAMTNEQLTKLGLVYRGAIPSGASLDNYVEVGIWDINGTNPTNLPTGSSGYVPIIVLPRWGHGNIKQIIISRGNEIYLRNKNDGEAWQSWYKFAGTEVS